VRCATSAQPPVAYVDCTVAGPAPPAQRSALEQQRTYFTRQLSWTLPLRHTQIPN
jgi:hypothetical protein